MSKEKKEFKVEVKSKRVCECDWHEEIELKKYQECPICKSPSFHMLIEEKIYT